MNNIHNWGNAAIGTASVSNNIFRVANVSEFLNDVKIGNAGSITENANSSMLWMTASNGWDIGLNVNSSSTVALTGGQTWLNTDDVRMKQETRSSGNIRYPVTTINGGSSFGMAAAPVGTIRYVANTTGSSITVTGHTINAGEARGFIRAGSTWYPLQ